MKLKDARITFLVGQDSTTIELMDYASMTTFLEIKLTPQQLSSALSRLSCTNCEISVFGLDKLNKKHSSDMFTFEIPESLYKSRDNDKLEKECLLALKRDNKSEWKSDGYYKSQNSFVINNDKFYANVTIRKWE